MTSARFERVVGESGKLMDIEGFERDNWVLDIIFKVFFLFFFFVLRTMMEKCGGSNFYSQIRCFRGFRDN